MNDKNKKSFLKFICFGLLYYFVRNDLFIDINLFPRRIFNLFGFSGAFEFGIPDDIQMVITSLLALVTLIYAIICLLQLFDLKFLRKR